jgi:hypothetical protein
MKIHRYARFNDPRSRKIMSMEEEYGANVMYNNRDGAVIVGRDDTTGKEYWVRLSSLECAKLLNLMNLEGTR